MRYVAGVDIGNATTEVAIASIEGNEIEFLASGIGPTTGIKGTLDNISGVFYSLKNALDKLGMDYTDLSEVRINEAAPVIGDVAMGDLQVHQLVDNFRLAGGLDAHGGGLPAEQFNQTHIVPPFIMYSCNQE